MFPGTIEIHGDDIFRGTNKLHSSRLEQPTILIYLKYFITIGNISISVRPILDIGEYSLVALQYRRIRYISLRILTDTDTPAVQL